MRVESTAKFSIGELVDHQLFGYRGVIFDVDPSFQQSEEWYDNVAKSRPPKDQPWYHVLPHRATHSTYVAERNLRPAEALDPIEHPMIQTLFTAFDGHRYEVRREVN